MWLLLAASLAVADAETTISVSKPAVLLATINATCTQCDWGVEHREAVMLRVTVNGRYSQHVPLVRAATADYRVLLGTVNAGTQRIRVTVDRRRSAHALRDETSASVRISNVDAVSEGDPRFVALAHAPFIYERANAVGRFSDVPVFMWYETEPTERGVRYRYSAIFTNEDGGTPADRLMATWGRTTDIEYVYSVEIGQDGRVLSHDIQGPDHKILPYRAALEAQHARLWVVTDNNMVLDRGKTSVRFAPAPFALQLQNVSREVVMDQHPWLYAVASSELARERKIVADAPPGQGTIPDPRRYAYIEGCGTLGGHALTFAIKVGNQWVSSDRGVNAYRIARDGCFRAAIPLPTDTTGTDVEAIRVQAFEREKTPVTAPVRFTHINTLFTLDDHHVPGPRLFEWSGAADLRAGEPPLEIAVK